MSSSDLVNVATLDLRLQKKYQCTALSSLKSRQQSFGQKATRLSTPDLCFVLLAVDIVPLAMKKTQKGETVSNSMAQNTHAFSKASELVKQGNAKRCTGCMS